MKDLLLKNANLVCGKICDIGIHNGKIVEIGSCIEEGIYNKVIKLKSYEYVSAGWIDLHTHSYSRLELYSDKPDEIGLKSGVTTVVDTGTAGALNIEDFYQLSKRSKTNVYAFLNISKTGIIKQSELSNLEDIDLKLIKSSIEKYPDFIVGLKARMSKSVIGDNGILPLKKALEAKNENGNIPLMVHVGSKPPEIGEIIDLLGENDILTHCYHGKENGLFEEGGYPKKEVLKALGRGLHIDVGHGKDSFSFKIAKEAMDNNVKPHTISTDIYERNRINGPVFNMATTLAKFLYLGYTLEQIIEAVTINPAKAIKLKTKGRLEKGMDGDITIFSLNNEEIELIDSQGVVVKGNKKICPLAVVLNGEYIDLKEVAING